MKDTIAMQTAHLGGQGGGERFLKRLHPVLCEYGQVDFEGITTPGRRRWSRRWCHYVGAAAGMESNQHHVVCAMRNARVSPSGTL